MKNHPTSKLFEVLFPLIFLAAPLAAHEGEEQKLLASDGSAGAALGRAVSVFDETILAGAPGAGGSGAAYVFVHDGLSWVEEAKLVASDPALGDLFGQSVAVYGDLAVVGAPGKALLGGQQVGVGAGAAYVFVRNGSVWVEEAKLLPLSPTAGAAFGTSVSVYGETVIVGAPQNALGAASSGTAFVFVRSGGVWTQEAQLFPGDGQSKDGFGTAVSAGLDRVAVGSPLASGLSTDSGAAYVYTRSGGLWSFSSKVTADDGARNDFFGQSVSLWEATLAVGAPSEDSTALNNGASYLFGQSGNGYVQRAKYAGLSAGDRFGTSVGFNHRVHVSGVRFDDDEGTETGSMQLYIDLGTRVGYQIFVASDAQPGDLLGSSVAAGDCWFAAGAVGDDDLGVDAGAVYVYVTHAQVTLANGSGRNPTCLVTTEPPVIGADWKVDVDASGFPNAAFTQVLVYYRLLATPVSMGFGEILVDRSSALVFASMLPGASVTEHSFPIPPDPWLIGLEVGAQGFVRDGSFGLLGACNAELVRIGCHN